MTIAGVAPATNDRAPGGTTRDALTIAELSAITRDIAARPDLWRSRLRFEAAERWWTRLKGPTNAHDGLAVSIHAHSPRLTQMTCYSQVSGQLSPPHTILTREPEAVG